MFHRLSARAALGCRVCIVSSICMASSSPRTLAKAPAPAPLPPVRQVRPAPSSSSEFVSRGPADTWATPVLSSVDGAATSSTISPLAEEPGRPLAGLWPGRPGTSPTRANGTRHPRARSFHGELPNMGARRPTTSAGAGLNTHPMDVQTSSRRPMTTGGGGLSSIAVNPLGVMGPLGQRGVGEAWGFGTDPSGSTQGFDGEPHARATGASSNGNGHSAVEGEGPTDLHEQLHEIQKQLHHTQAALVSKYRGRGNRFVGGAQFRVASKVCAECEGARRNLKRAKAEEESLRQEVSTLHKRLAEAEAAVSQMGSSLNDARQQLAQREKELEEAGRRGGGGGLGDATGDAAAVAASAAEAANAREAALDESLREAREQIDDLRRQLSEAHAHRAAEEARLERQSGRASVAQEKAQAEAQAEVERLRAAVARLEAAVEDGLGRERELGHRLELEEGASREARAGLRRAETQREGAERAHAEAASQAAARLRRIGELEAEAAARAARCARAEEALTRSDAEGVAMRLAHEAELAAMRASLVQAEATQRAVNDLERQRDVAQAAAERGMRERAEAALADAQAACEASRGEADRLRRDASTLAAELARADETIEALERAAAEQQQQQAAGWKQLVQAREASGQALAIKEAAARQQLKQATEALHRAEAEAALATAKAEAEVAEELEALRRRLAAAEEAKAQTERESAAEIARLIKIIEQLEKASKVDAALQAQERDESNANRAAAEEARRAAEEAARRHCAERSALEAKLADADADADRARQQLQQLQQLQAAEKEAKETKKEAERQAENAADKVLDALQSSVRLCVVAPTVNVSFGGQTLTYKAPLPKDKIKQTLETQVLPGFTKSFVQEGETASPEAGVSMDDWLKGVTVNMQGSIEKHLQKVFREASV